MWQMRWRWRNQQNRTAPPSIFRSNGWICWIERKNCLHALNEGKTKKNSISLKWQMTLCEMLWMCEPWLCIWCCILWEASFFLQVTAKTTCFESKTELIMTSPAPPMFISIVLNKCLHWLSERLFDTVYFVCVFCILLGFFSGRAATAVSSSFFFLFRGNILGASMS